MADSERKYSLAELAELAEKKARRYQTRVAPPELAPDPPQPGTTREMAHDSVVNLYRAIQLMAHRIRCDVENERGFVPDKDTAKAIKDLQAIAAGLAAAHPDIVGLNPAKEGAEVDAADTARVVELLREMATERERTH